MSPINLTYKAPAGTAWYVALLFCALFPSREALAAPDNFVHGRPTLAQSAGRLVLSLPLSVDNEDALADLLRDGASIELRIKVIVERRRSIWFNETIHEEEFAWVLRYDPLGRDFRMSAPGGEQSLQGKNLRALLSRTWKRIKLPLAESAAFQQGEDYLVRADFSLKHTALPPWLDRTLVFWNKDVVSPAGIELEYKVEDAPISR